MKPAKGPDVAQIPVEQFPEEEGEEIEYEVEAITARRVKHGETQYLVKWKGYMYEDSTWEPEAELVVLRNCESKIEQYLARQSGAQRHDSVVTLEHHAQIS
eukprot:SAG11_NODE_2235_length_3653_cov_20.005346_2_plen_101_part_00